MLCTRLNSEIDEDPEESKEIKEFDSPKFTSRAPTPNNIAIGVNDTNSILQSENTDKVTSRLNNNSMISAYGCVLSDVINNS